MLESKSGETSGLDAFSGMRVCVRRGVWMGVGCPCPPVCNDIVTPRHLFEFVLT